MSERQFPVLLPNHLLKCRTFECPSTVPWSLLAPHERQALYNHGQTLEQLASRGGLSPCEIMWVIERKRWQGTKETEAQAAKRLKDLLAKL